MGFALTPEHFIALGHQGMDVATGYNWLHQLAFAGIINRFTENPLYPVSDPVRWVYEDIACQHCPVNPTSIGYDQEVVDLMVGLSPTGIIGPEVPCIPLSREIVQANTLWLRILDKTMGRSILMGDLKTGLPPTIDQPINNIPFWLEQFKSVKNYSLQFNYFPE